MRRTQEQANYWVVARWRSITLTTPSFCPPRKFASIKTENGHAILHLKYWTLISTTIWWEKCWQAIISEGRQKLQRILKRFFPQPFFKYDHKRDSLSRADEIVASLWSGQAWPPKNEPKCGFTGSHCKGYPITLENNLIAIPCWERCFTTTLLWFLTGASNLEAVLAGSITASLLMLFTTTLAGIIVAR